MMKETIDGIYKKIRELEAEIEEALTRAEKELHYRIEQKRISFENGVLELHKKLRKPLVKFIREADLFHVLTAPVIYSLIFPMALVDACATLYQIICFPVYGIKKVRRSDFIMMDRHHLGYLNVIEKINCVYCGYANGLAAYIREIAARTERYWCPIKHARRMLNPHPYYHEFADYGNAEEFRERMRILVEENKDKK